MTPISEDIKKLIDDEAIKRYPDFWGTINEETFKEHVVFGYSLRQQELERLKAIIQKQWNDYNNHVKTKNKEQKWQQFKSNNNL